MEFHLVSHTHWDREWYRTAEEFRQRLVDLIDELLADPPGDGQAFLLDGQTIVIDDYIAVRPSQRERLRGLLLAGRIEAGPWYVLADELIPGGEALVRNLLGGRHTLDSFGVASPPILYCPDSFGHPAALPELAVGFGLPLIVLWRGYGGRRWPAGDVVRWRGPSGAEAIVFHLPPDGYEFGSSLPAERDAAVKRWTHAREVLAARSTVGVTLVQNGADHHARQASLGAATDLLAELASATGDRLKVSSMRSFAESLLKRASSQTLSAITGELRDSYGYTWTLQGTFATRAAQKRRNAIAERALLDAEAWCAVARMAGGASRIDHLRAAWRSLLDAHPHDTLCGTSIDDVARAMDVRIRSAKLQAHALRDRAIDSLVGHDPAVVREMGGEARDVLLVSNGVPYDRGGVVIVEQLDKLDDERVGPGSGGGARFSVVGATVRADSAPEGTQLLSAKVRRDRIESARHYPDNDIVRSRKIACYLNAQAGMSVRVLESARSEAVPAAPVRVANASIESGPVRLGFTARGDLSADMAGHVVENLVRFEDRADTGDLYTPSIGKEVAVARFKRQRITHRGPLVGELQQEWSLKSSATVVTTLRMLADAPLIEIDVVGENYAGNHRLRIGVATGVSGMVVADAAFGPVERKAPVVPDEDTRAETPPSTAPLHRYVTVFGKSGGVTIHSDGLAEYEVDREGVVWITLVRAVGDLSRNDIPERPGHAGWPAATPMAQSLGRFRARIAVHSHGTMSPATVQLIDRESDRFLNPVRGVTLRSTLTSTEAAGDIELSGVGLAASAIKESEDGRAIVLRCVNLTDREQHGTWSVRGHLAANLARLDETVGEAIATSETGARTVIPFVAGPRGIVTVVVSSLASRDGR